MGEKREIVCRYVGKGLAVSVATSIAGIKRSTYYYTGNGRPKGKQPSTFTYNCLIGNVSNDMLVNKIIDLIAPEYNDYGYQTVTELLKQQGYVINHKKVRRIMRDNNLLHPKVLKSNPLNKEYVDLQTVIIKIRTDNGPQFIAKKLAQALKTLGIAHEFIKPGTPQQNAHIEAFHSTITRLVCNRNIFEDLEHAIRIFCDFFYAYNYTRAMKSLLYYPPLEFLKLWKSKILGIKKDKKNREIFFFREKPAPKLVTGLSAEVLEGINKSNTFEPRNLTTKKNSPVL